MDVSDIKWLHVESSTRCNAWCPACGRNNNGYGLSDNLVEQDLSTDRFTEIVRAMPNLEAVQFCGNLGDPVAGKNILDLVDIVKSLGVKIQIHTNGSLRSEQWWSKLGILLAGYDHDVWFGIDGLAGVHEIYRQGTDYKKIIKNASAFINSGGYATWQFIPYEHNEHQIVDCLRKSQEVGFKKFKLVKLFRNVTSVRHYKTGKDFILAPPAEFRNIIKFHKNNKVVLENSCMHLEQPSIYLNANGTLSYCCYQYNNSVDNLEDLMYNKVDLTNKICLSNCGS